MVSVVPFGYVLVFYIYIDPSLGFLLGVGVVCNGNVLAAYQIIIRSDQIRLDQIRFGLESSHSVLDIVRRR